uniref:Expressed protein n=1 Tax=Oryza sativa subsp. japonica TaxID=39947 RepID=Q6F2I4_ORYSJ|nr:expressed protein [Oryza sativa Japonica Group]
MVGGDAGQERRGRARAPADGRRGAARVRGQRPARKERRAGVGWREERSRCSGAAGRARAQRCKLDGDNGHVRATAGVVGRRGRGAHGGWCRQPLPGEGSPTAAARAGGGVGGPELDDGSGAVGRARAGQRELDGDNGHVGATAGVVGRRGGRHVIHAEAAEVREGGGVAGAAKASLTGGREDDATAPHHLPPELCRLPPVRAPGRAAALSHRPAASCHARPGQPPLPHRAPLPYPTAAPLPALCQAAPRRHAAVASAASSRAGCLARDSPRRRRCPELPRAGLSLPSPPPVSARAKTTPPPSFPLLSIAASSSLLHRRQVADPGHNLLAPVVNRLSPPLSCAAARSPTPPTASSHRSRWLPLSLCLPQMHLEICVVGPYGPACLFVQAHRPTAHRPIHTSSSSPGQATGAAGGGGGGGRRKHERRTAKAPASRDSGTSGRIFSGRPFSLAPVASAANSAQMPRPAEPPSSRRRRYV